MLLTYTSDTCWAFFFFVLPPNVQKRFQLKALTAACKQRVKYLAVLWRLG